MYIDNENFNKWMEKLSKKLNEIGQNLQSLINTDKVLDENDRLLDNQDLCQLLQASKRSLQRYRSSGTLRYQMLWHKIYYKESDVEDFLKNHFDEFKGCRKVEKKGS